MQQIPKEFYCPISQEIMKDPVIGPDSHTYERSDIVDWLNHHHTSPFTRQQMDASQLVPNLALRNAIQDMMKGSFPVQQIHEAIPVKVEANCPLDLQLNAIRGKDDVGLLHLSVVPPTEGARKPCAVVCLVDTSGSMGGTGSIEQLGEKTPLSILDLVKHSVTTIIHMLDQNDYLAIIDFSDSAKLVFDFQQMSATGKEAAVDSLKVMYPQSGTNIWDALRVANNLINSRIDLKGVNTSIWLFTDGEPNINPPRGILSAMKGALDDKSPSFTINTFGFGYSLDSRMLFELSVLGSGIFGYIPDCNIVGTTFVNCLCNTLSAGVPKATIELKTEGIDKFLSVGYPMNKNCIDVGQVQFGQSRDFIIQFQVPLGHAFKISAKLKYQGKEIVKEINNFCGSENSNTLYQALCRCKSNEYLKSSLDMHTTGKMDFSFLKIVPEMINSLPCANDEIMQALVRDYTSANENEGRVSKAYSSNDRLLRWGRHYIRSIIRAHQLQQCHNFKDPGVQLYGGNVFKLLQIKADKIFCSLPPPVPSIKLPPPGAPAKAQAAAVLPPPPTQVEMQGYLDCGGGGCFCGDGIVKLADGTLKQVKNLQKGDCVLDSNGIPAKIICVVIFPIKKEINMVEINGVGITPRHPIRISGIWKLPNSINMPKKIYCDFIYNLVLDQNHVVCINNIDMVTLGHGKNESSIVQHPYYGTYRVLEDLKKVRGWDEGILLMENYKKYKDPFTRMVMSIH